MEVYIDGSFRAGRGGWAVYWGPDHPRNESGPLRADEPQTCARAEVRALFEVLRQIRSQKQQEIIGPVEVKCDNEYVVKGYGGWVNAWQRNDFHGIAHADLWRGIYDLRDPNVRVVHVRGHQGIAGNEAADQMAKHAGNSARVRSDEVTDYNGNQYYDGYDRYAGYAEPEPERRTTTAKASTKTSTSYGSGSASYGSGSTSYGSGNGATAAARAPRRSATAAGTSRKIRRVEEYLQERDVLVREVPYGRQFKLPNIAGALIVYDKGTHLAQGPFWQDLAGSLHL